MERYLFLSRSLGSRQLVTNIFFFASRSARGKEEDIGSLIASIKASSWEEYIGKPVDCASKVAAWPAIINPERAEPAEIDLFYRE